MKFKDVLGRVTDAFAAVRLGGSKKSPKLAALDRGVLEVALMVAALDGAILPAELAAFDTLAKKCRGYTAKGARAQLDRALQKAGYLMALAQTGVYTEEERIRKFVELAVEALPTGFVSGSPADLRRAFALWVAMGVSDGMFSDTERLAVEALRDCFAEFKYAEAKALEACWLACSPALRQAQGSKSQVKRIAVLEPDFLEKAEAIMRELSTSSAKSSAALEELIALGC